MLIQQLFGIEPKDSEIATDEAIPNRFRIPVVQMNEPNTFSGCFLFVIPFITAE